MPIRFLLLLSLPVAACFAAGCRTTQHNTGGPTMRVSSSQNAEVGCATCVFHMKDVVGCKLAVRIDGQAYLVVGSDIDDHGDAHAADGLCNAVRNATVEGKLSGNRFVAEKIQLVP